MTIVVRTDHNPAEWLGEICAVCGLTRGSHHAGQPEWCPAHESRMDWTKTTTWKPSGTWDSREYGTPAGSMLPSSLGTDNPTEPK